MLMIKLKRESTRKNKNAIVLNAIIDTEKLTQFAMTNNAYSHYVCLAFLFMLKVWVKNSILNKINKIMQEYLDVQIFITSLGLKFQINAN